MFLIKFSLYSFLKGMIMNLNFELKFYSSLNGHLPAKECLSYCLAFSTMSLSFRELT